MSKGNSGLFNGTVGTKTYVNGKDYNTANSNSVGVVYYIKNAIDLHAIPIKDCLPNSVIRVYNNGELKTERYFNSMGNAYLDIDYTDHGNPKIHSSVPHEHKIHFDKNGNPIRDVPPKGGINK